MKTNISSRFRLKTKSIFTLLLMVFSTIGFAQEPDPDKGIQFNEDAWAEILQLAKAENKPIFLDVYASWCGPCKALKHRTFPDASAGEYFNENYINVTLDAEKGEGIKIARQLRVDAYPSLYILNPNGEALLLSQGFHSPEELIELGKEGIMELEKMNGF